MIRLSKNKKNNNVIVTTKAKTTLLALATIIVIGTTTLVPHWMSIAEAQRALTSGGGAPVVVSGDNIYIAWWTNNTENGNQEVMFRASNEGGATFGDKMNLSNTTDADSSRVEIAAEGADVIVTWWETNQTSDTPVARMSNDGGQTFGSVLRLSTNGTIDSTAEAEVAAEAGEL